MTCEASLLEQAEALFRRRATSGCLRTTGTTRALRPRRLLRSVRRKTKSEEYDHDTEYRRSWTISAGSYRG